MKELGSVSRLIILNIPLFDENQPLSCEIPRELDKFYNLKCIRYSSLLSKDDYIEQMAVMTFYRQSTNRNLLSETS